MDPATLAALFAMVAVSSAGAVYTNNQNIKFAKGANSEAIQLANTAHQREVADLRAAGLNPILSASGSGAQVPQLKTPSLENPLESFASNAGSFADAVNGMTKAEVETAKAGATSAKAERDMLTRANDLDSYTTDLQKLQTAAELQALRPDAVWVGDDSFAYNSPTWWKLVDQKTNELETGAYKSSLGHAYFEDAITSAGAVGDVVSSLGRGVGAAARGIFGNKGYKGGKQDSRGRRGRR